MSLELDQDLGVVLQRDSLKIRQNNTSTGRSVREIRNLKLMESPRNEQTIIQRKILKDGPFGVSVV